IGPQRLRLEPGLELHRQVPRVRRQLDDFDELAVERAPGDHQAALGERPLVEAIELVAVTVALVNDRLAVEVERPRPGPELAGVGPETHRSAEIVDAEEVAQLVDDVLRRGRAAPPRNRLPAGAK